MDAIWLFQGVTLLCSAAGLLVLALMIVDADLASKMLGLLLAGDMPGGNQPLRAIA